MKKLILIAACLSLCGCSSGIKAATNNIADPTERGLMYVATAIVISAIIRAIFNE